MRILNNLPALHAFTSLNKTNKALQKTISALSTGLRVKSSADDAAGFAISERMRSQISGLNVAARNTQDGVSLLQTAEGALGQTNSMLQRMRELAIQASNDSLTSQDRQYLQLEVDELKDQIDRIANTTQFNRKRILDGSSGALWSSDDLSLKARINGGLVTTDQFGQKVNHEGNFRIEVSAEPGVPHVQKSAIMTTWKTETDYGADAVPEDVTETVRILVYDEVIETEERLTETVTLTEEPYIIYINGSEYGNIKPPVDNVVEIDEIVNADEVADIRAKWRYDPATEATLSLSSGGSSIFSKGDKFVYNLAASALSPEAKRTVEISGTQAPDWAMKWGSDVTDAPVYYGLDADAVSGSSLTFSNFYLNSENGTVYEGDIVLSTSGTILSGSTLAEFDALRNNPVTTTTYDAADSSTKLTEIPGFYNTEGVFLLDQPQTLTITQGNGKTTSVILYATDTIEDVRTKLNDAIADGLGQGRCVDVNNFVSYVTDPREQGSESVAGTFVIRSAVPGKAGELYFSGDQDLLDALGLNTIQESSESTLTASVYDAHSGAAIAQNVKATGQEFVSLIPPEIDIEVDPMAGLAANWDENTKQFMMATHNVYSAMLHLKNNGTIFQTGANGGEDFMIDLGDTSSAALNLSRVNVLTHETASRSISILDRAISRIAAQRAKIGSYENALEHTMNNLTSSGSNLTAAESRIRDLDMAYGMMDLVKLQILNQSGTSMLSQANQIPNSVLTLLQN